MRPVRLGDVMSLLFIVSPTQADAHMPAGRPPTHRGAGRRRARIARPGPIPLAAVALLAAVAILLGGPARPVAAQVDGGSGADGVTITIVRWEGQDRVQAQGGASDDGCDYGLVVGPPGFVPDLTTVGPRPPDAHLAVLTCNGAALGLVWVGPHNTVDLAEAARAAAQRWVETVPVPTPTLVTSPPDAGLVGVETWFWLDHAARDASTDRVEAYGFGVDVRMVPSAVTWAFGDGTTTSGGVGEAWPRRSSIRHAYQRGDVVDVRATQRLEPGYRVAGSDWLALPPIPVEATTTHEVREVQALLTS
jgi:hypothetical protein